MKVIIIGAGLTGLSAAEQLKKKAEVKIFEKNIEAGGLARSAKTELSQSKDFIIHDLAGHFLHFKNNRTKEKVQSLFKYDELLEVERKSFIYTHSTFVPYPFQSHIYYLPADIKKECLVGFLNNLKIGGREVNNNFYNWMLNQYGNGIVKYFMLPYNQKMWTVHPEELTTEWMLQFVPKPSPEDIMLGAVSEWKRQEGYNATFFYPRYGIGELVKKYTEKIGDIIKCEKEIINVDSENKTVTLSNGNKEKYDYLITTAPLKELILDMMKTEDKKLKDYAEKLRHNSLLYFNIGWKGDLGEGLPDKKTNWIYFPEEQFDFYRVGFFSNASKDTCPPGYNSCYIEIAYPEGKPPLQQEYDDKIVSAWYKLIEIGIIVPEEKGNMEHLGKGLISPAYVICDKNWNESRKFLLNWLEERDIFSGGRYGGWEYSAMDDAIEWGERLAEKCLSR